MEKVTVQQAEDEAKHWGLNMIMSEENAPMFGEVGSRSLTIWLPQAQAKTLVPVWKQCLTMLSRELQASEPVLAQSQEVCSPFDWTAEMSLTDLLAIPESSTPVSTTWKLESATENEQRIPITVLCGVSGSGKTVVADSMVAVTEDKVEWSVVRNKPADGVQWQVQAVCEQLMAFASQTPDEKRSKRVLVLTPGHVQMPIVMQTLCCHPELSSLFYVSGVACVLNMQQAWIHREEWGSVLPALKEQLYGGWAQSVLINKHEAVDQEFVEAQEDKLRQMIPGIVVMKVSNGRVLAHHERAQVLSDAWLNASSQKARMRAAPGWMFPAAAPAHNQAVQGVFVSLPHSH